MGTISENWPENGQGPNFTGISRYFPKKFAAKFTETFVVSKSKRFTCGTSNKVMSPLGNENFAIYILQIHILGRGAHLFAPENAKWPKLRQYSVGKNGNR